MFTWKILDIDATDGLITQAQYSVKSENVETEGYWVFGDPVLRVPFEEVTEEMVINWVREDSMRDGKNIIESRLEEQSITKPKVVAPWLPQVFTPNLG